MQLMPEGAVPARDGDGDAQAEGVVVKVVLLGALRRLAGRREAELRLPPNSTIHTLARALRPLCDPSFERVLTSEGDLQVHVAVFLNGVQMPQANGVPTYLPAGQVELMFVPMYEGG